MTKRLLKYSALIVLSAALSVGSVLAASKANGFFVTDKVLKFETNLSYGKCFGKIPYPELYNSDTALSDMINQAIQDFAETYAICNDGERSNFSVRYDIPESRSKDYFSVRWITEKDGKLYRTDSIGFNKENGDLLTIGDVLSDMSGTILNKLVELSRGHLDKNVNRHQLEDKFARGDIRLYISEGKWYIVFNPTDFMPKAAEAELPKYFLKGD